MLQAVRSQITEAQKIASGGGSEQDIAEAKIELEVVLPRLPFSMLSLMINATGFREFTSFNEVIGVSLNRL